MSEASGLASSERNPGVLWTHNDGACGKIYAFQTNGALLATFEFSEPTSDIEDIAVGPRTKNGISCFYIGDIGGNLDATHETRSGVQILRVPEPFVDLAWAANPRTITLEGIEKIFLLYYPENTHDAEALLIDPLTIDVFIATKQDGNSFLYRANLANAHDDDVLYLEYAGIVPFGRVTAGDISADGSQIALRSKDAAMLWSRCNQEDIPAKLRSGGTTIPVVGRPVEPQGEAFAFLRHSLGYATISEGFFPVFYGFESLCPTAPRFTASLTNRSVFPGQSTTFAPLVVGYPLPVCQWSHDGIPIPGQTNCSLFLTNIAVSDSGTYSVTAINAYGSATNSATLNILPKPDLRITEVLSNSGSNSLRLQFYAEAGIYYELEAASDLLNQNWIPTGDIFNAPTNTLVTFEKDFPSEPRFFRVMVR